MNRTDRLMLAELGTRVPRIPPTLPDLEPPSSYWLGGAGAEVQHWKARALVAEQTIAELREALRAWRPLA